MILALLLFCSSIQAFDLDRVYLDFGWHLDPTKHPYLPSKYEPNQRLDLGIDLSLWPVLHWENKIKTLTDQSQYRMLGWNYRFSLEMIDKKLFLYYEHESLHLLDAEFRGTNVNIIGVKWFIYER